MSDAASKLRVESLDVFRGWMILAVVGIHVTGAAMNVRGIEFITSDAMLVLNRTLQFAVPGFLFMTALVFGMQFRDREFRAREFYSKRWRGVIVPYVVWTAVYILWHVSGPGTIHQLVEVRRWMTLLVEGKGFYHLYFLIVVIQFYAILPGVLWCLRRVDMRRPASVVAWIVAVMAVQVGWYWLNRTTLRIGNIGSIVFSYSAVLGIGALAGRLLPEIKTSALVLPTKWLGLSLGAVIVSWGWCVPTWFAALRQQPVNAFSAQASLWVYALAWSALVLVACLVAESIRKPDSRVYRLLLVLGSSSMQIYLLHPMLLDMVKRIVDPASLGNIGLITYVASYPLLVAIPVFVAMALQGKKVSGWLFGR
jgi:surface polysaccharide O-acyltransferase-like enzyme